MIFERFARHIGSKRVIGIRQVGQLERHLSPPRSTNDECGIIQQLNPARTKRVPSLTLIRRWRGRGQPLSRLSGVPWAGRLKQREQIYEEQFFQV
jgi:hypothetical protein